jgi:hypothetical protein
MSQWYVKTKGNKVEIADVLETTVDLPKSVHDFFVNSAAYYDSDTEFEFFSEGSLSEESVVLLCNISFKPLLAETLVGEEKATQMPA